MKLLCLFAIAVTVANAGPLNLQDQQFMFALDPLNPIHAVAGLPTTNTNFRPFAKTRPLEIFNPQTERRVRQLELYQRRVRKERIIPRCLSPITTRLRPLTRLHDAQQAHWYHSSNRSDISYAQSYGGFQSMEEVLGQISMDGYSDTCECLIPLYKRQMDGYRYRWDYGTRRLSDYHYGMDWGTNVDRDLDNWSIEGWCVPHRGQCGANVRLSRMYPSPVLQQQEPDLVLVSTTEDRTKFGEQQMWSEDTLCYIWE